MWLPSNWLAVGCVMAAVACGGGVEYPAPDSIVFLADRRDPCPGDPPSVVAAVLEGDDLVVDLSYTGCAVAPTWVCWDQLIFASYPPQVFLQLGHEPAGGCSSSLADTRRVPLDRVIEIVNRYGSDGPLYVRVGEFFLLRKGAAELP